MTRANKGNYRAKHPEGTHVDAGLAQAVSHALAQGPITCRATFDIALQLGMAPVEVGKAIDLQEGRIHACQLGLFGYGAKENRVKKARQISDDLRTAIDQALVEGRLHCIDAWRIADRLKLKRIEIAQACEAMQVKIDKCQIGTF